ncbi:MAG: tRNA (adenosine(37)-N6)-threonylcarbamoyltransferase complex ATPase subunit type 1 TsaE [Salibacteraceae bacterium]
MQQTLTVSSPDKANALIECLKPMFSEHKIFCFHGDLGAGKTTYIKLLCKSLGVEDDLSSPSFSIVNEYSTSSGETVFHFDLYRLKSPEELMDIGWEDYLNSSALIFVEWPGNAGKYMPDDAVHLMIETDDLTQRRTITINDLP